MKILQKPKQLKRVAAYCRISMVTDRTELSYQAQTEYYRHLISKNPEWHFAGIYSDHGISATSTKQRLGLQELLGDARAGKIDLILTKSISRLARNTVDLLNITREMKSIGVEVLFEKENISNLTADGELMLTLLASFAQAESEQRSRDVRWAMERRFKEGKAFGFRAYGYTSSSDATDVEIIPEEAEVIRWIYDQYLKKVSCEKMAKILEDRGVRFPHQPTPKVSPETIRHILKAPYYTGDLYLQRFYSKTIGGRSKYENKGEYPLYIVKNGLPQIISHEQFEAVQKEIKRRRDMGAKANWSLNPIALTGMLKCKCCGRSYIRCKQKPTTKNNIHTHIWKCQSLKERRPCTTTTRAVADETIRELIADVLQTDGFDEEVFLEKISYIEVGDAHTFTFYFKDGSTVERQYRPNFRSRYWTPEIKEAWSKALRAKAKRARSLGLAPCTTKFLPEELEEFRRVAKECSEQKRKEIVKW